MITDETLYRRYVSGDDEGLNGLMERYGNSLTFYINGYIHDLYESEDLMVEAFSYLIAKKPKIRDGGFRGYLYKTARHMALHCKAKKRSHQCFQLDDLVADPQSHAFVEEIVQTEEQNRILHLCMEQLSPDYREALYLVYFENMSHAEAGVIMHKSQKQVSNLVCRGKKALRQKVEKEGISSAK
ncbi:MAG: sigma-70 family RNA polymerase sigma factor [Anaerostipes sp.]|nr:sigma-70 family RNA polymerase sigma factor [Anaerostipes sp.]